jgi:C-terminal processing protease CtpA/Prc
MEAAMRVIKQTERSTYVDVEGSPWEPTKFPGVWQKMLYKEEDGSAFTALMKFEPGQKVTVTLNREGREMKVDVTLVEKQ